MDAKSLDADALARLQHLADRQEILDCLTRLSRGVDRFDRNLVLSAYHPDAIDDHMAFVGSPADFYEWVCGASSGINAVTRSHQMTNHSCEIDGDVAHAETYYLAATHKHGSDVVTLSTGRYIDRLERRDGVWKIAMRYCVGECRTAVPAAASPFEGIPDLHLNGVPSHGPDDPSYRRPLVNKRAMRKP